MMRIASRHSIPSDHIPDSDEFGSANERVAQEAAP
ncbi:hypothetical protein M218_18030 [Burkholderia pseudomallei MSHR338]|nr:hypothetical protein BPC006_I3916 [Burkholderia pseudomallei BPC006]EQA87634.1 hypothetical protein M218_18030 [Burkholderia pseudomallei MSHR338]